MAAVDLRGNAIYVQSYSRHPYGLDIINGWLHVLAQDADDTLLGQVVLEALHKSEGLVEGLAEGRERALAALLRAAGVRSYRKYVTGTRAIRATLEPQSSSITFTPCRNGGPTGPDRGFHFLKQFEFSIPHSSMAADVGRATRTAMDAAR